MVETHQLRITGNRLQSGIVLMLRVSEPIPWVVEMRANEKERGAALVEMAFVTPLLLMMVFGIVEFGMAFHERLTVANSTQTAARIGSALGTDEQTDYEIVQAIAQGLETLPNAGVGIVKYVAIFEADSNGNPTTTCAIPGGSSACNVYTYAPGTWTSPPCDWSPCPNIDAGGSLGGGWGDDFGAGSPPERDTELPGLDVMGVRVYYAHTWLFGGLPALPAVDCVSGTSDCWSDVALFRFEPEQFGIATP